MRAGLEMLTIVTMFCVCVCVCVCARARERERERGLVSYVQFSFVEAATSVLFRATWYHRFADSEKLKLVL